MTIEHRETRDGYGRVIFSNGCHRVILCKDGIQWIIQRRRPNALAGRAAWDALAYCTTKKALIRLSRPLFGLIPPEIAGLPDHCGRSTGIARPMPQDLGVDQ